MLYGKFSDRKGVVYSDRTKPTDNKNDCKVLCDKQQFSSMYGICEEDIFAAITEDLKTKLTQK